MKIVNWIKDKIYHKKKISTSLVGSRRLKRLSMTYQFFECWFKNKDINLKIKNPLPDDAKILNAFINSDVQTVELIVYSEKFPLIREGALIGHMTPIEFQENRTK